MSELKQILFNELMRIEEDALYSMKGHYNAFERWRFWYTFLGIINVICSVVAGITAFSGIDNLIQISAIITAVVTGLATFLECAKKAESHRASGNGFLKIKNKARYLREIQSEFLDQALLEKEINELLKQKDELNSSSLVIPRFAYKKAKKDIEEGRADYKVDNKEN
ncbi:SLATT domain-containing protein [Pasteurella sp. PK-2025]|uniref:SLATT domain-containing protein n=1 Tax=Pasteurella sp. PK-2025 TaxID=3413133 RepID=UPI003C734457